MEIFTASFGVNFLKASRMKLPPISHLANDVFPHENTEKYAIVTGGVSNTHIY